MASVNQKLQSDAIRHATFLQRLRSHETNEILAFLDENVYPDLISEIERRLSKKLSVGRLIELRKAYETILKQGYSDASNMLKSDLKPISVAEAENQIRSLNKALNPFNIQTVIPNISLLEGLVNKNVRGQTISKWFSNLARTTADEITIRINNALAEGETVGRIVQRIRGTRARDFSDGVIKTTRRNAETIVRTAVNSITTQAREETYKKNSNVIKAVKWISTLDFKTSDICQARDGQVFNIGEGPRPPAHMQCRSTTVPITKSWKELGINLKEAPPGTRASLNGQVPVDESYPEWLRKQSVAGQNEALGKGRAAIFRRGKLSDKQIFTPRNKPLTLKEMTSLEKQFE